MFRRRTSVVLVLCALSLLLSSGEAQRKHRRPVKGTTKASDRRTCNLGLAQAPTLRGLRLGMSLDEVKAQFPKAQFKLESAVEVFKFTASDSEFPEHPLPEDESILSKPTFLFTALTSEEAANPSDFKGIDEIGLYFTGNSLTQIRMYYSDPQWWKDHDEFRDTIIKKLVLPEKGKYWGGGRNQTLSDGTQSYEIYTYYACRGFQAQVITGYPPILGKKVNPFYALVLLTNEDDEIAELYRQQEAKKAEQKRQKEIDERDRARRREAFKP